MRRQAAFGCAAAILLWISLDIRPVAESAGDPLTRTGGPVVARTLPRSPASASGPATAGSSGELGPRRAARQRMTSRPGLRGRQAGLRVPSARLADSPRTELLAPVTSTGVHSTPGDEIPDVDSDEPAPIAWRDRGALVIALSRDPQRLALADEGGRELARVDAPRAPRPGAVWRVDEADPLASRVAWIAHDGEGPAMRYWRPVHPERRQNDSEATEENPR